MPSLTSTRLARAAAVTAIARSIEATLIEFNADRPFLAAIVDRRTGRFNRLHCGSTDTMTVVTRRSSGMLIAAVLLLCAPGGGARSPWAAV